MNEKFCILIKISLKFDPMSPNNNILALVQIMAWYRSGDKPLSEPMLTQFIDAYMQHLGGDELKILQVMGSVIMNINQTLSFIKTWHAMGSRNMNQVRIIH